MKIVVTGASGLIGSHMVSFLKKKKHTVVPITNVDLRNTQEAFSAIPSCDLLFHFAADIGGIGYLFQYEYQTFMNNMQIDMNVIKVCEEKNISTLFYPSSACAYPGYIMTREENVNLSEALLDAPAYPDQMYGWEKYVMLKLSRVVPFQIRIGILHTIYGVGKHMEGEKSKFPTALAAKIIRNKKFGTPISIWGNGTQKRTFLHVQDAVAMIYEVATSKTYEGPMNISSEEVVSVRQCVDWLVDYAKVTDPVAYDPSKPVGALFRGVDMQKYKRLYSYRPNVSAQKGFQQLYDAMYDTIKP